MRNFSIVAVLLSALTFITALINQFHYRQIARNLELYVDDSIQAARRWTEAHHFSVMLGEIVLLAGAAAFVFCVIPAIKIRSKTASAGAIFSLAAVMLGLVQGTHVFV